MDMTSRDVIHSFWIPEMRVKQDLVPGMTTTLRFTPSVTGEYTVDCAELCGLSHYSMWRPCALSNRRNTSNGLPNEQLTQRPHSPKPVTKLTLILTSKLTQTPSPTRRHRNYGGEYNT